MTLRSIHNSFTRGELDPTLYARIDMDLYTRGARKLRNLIALWTGAATLAPGSTYTDIIVDRTNSNAPITDYTQVKAIDFQYDVDNDIIYTLVFRPDTTSTVSIDVYYDDTLQASVAAAAYTVAQIQELYFAVGQDRLLILHEDVQPRQLVRGASHSSWTLSAVALSVYPTFDFTTLGGTQYRTSGFTFTPAATSGSSVNLTASSAIFTNNHVGGIFIGNGGIARITSVTSTTVAVMNILDDFVSTSAIEGNLSSLSEVMWTSGGGTPAGEDRGWPARGTFYLNRLVLGRSASLKNIVALSTAGVYDNFDDSEADATAAFSASFNGKGNQSVQDIVADDSIVFLTSNKTFAQNPLVENPLSISNFYFSPQGQDPASNIPAVTLDNQILHISGNNSQVMQTMYSTGDAKYKSFPAGVLSTHLFQTLTSNSSWEPANIKARLYFATQENGTMLIYNSLLEEGISAWSLRTTRGDFRQVIGDGEQSHVIAERQVNIGTSYESNLDYVYVASTNFDAFSDVTSSFASASSDVQIFEEQYNYLLFGNDIPFTQLNVSLNTNASSDLGFIFEYMDSNGNWNTFSPTDGTSGFTGNGEITWSFDDVLNWAPNKIDRIDDEDYVGRYWIRLRRTTETVATLAIEDEITINTGVRLFIEKLSFDQYMDCSVNTSSDSAGDVTGLTNLAGQQVYAIADGATYGPFFVESDGTTNIKYEYSNVDIGIQFKPLLVPMPVVAATQEGDNVYQKRYIRNLYIDYVDSLYLQAGTDAQQQNIPVININDYTIGSPTPAQTGVRLIHPRGDWEARQEFWITQSIPGPMTIIGIGYHLEIT